MSSTRRRFVHAASVAALTVLFGCPETVHRPVRVLRASTNSICRCTLFGPRSETTMPQPTSRRCSVTGAMVWCEHVRFRESRLGARDWSVRRSQATRPPPAFRGHGPDARCRHGFSYEGSVERVGYVCWRMLHDYHNARRGEPRARWATNRLDRGTRDEAREKVDRIPLGISPQNRPERREPPLPRTY